MRKWVSLDTVPCIAWWWECWAESLWISKRVGCSEEVIWERGGLGQRGQRGLLEEGGGGRTLCRMESSTGVVDMVDMSRESRNALRCSIDAYGVR